MTATTWKLDIGPRDLAKPAVEKGPQFALASPSLRDIQAYVDRVRLLPRDSTKFAAVLKDKNPKSLAEFEKIIAVWKTAGENADGWPDLLDKIVTLASDCYHYGSSAHIYFQGVKSCAERLKKDENDEKAKEELRALIKSLENAAGTRAAKADAVTKEITMFSDKLKADQTAMQGPDGKSGVVKEYEQKFGNTDDQILKIDAEITKLIGELQTIRQEYEHYVTVSATTPTYAWISVIGTVIAVVVAGVYGAKASDALRRIDAQTAKLNEHGATQSELRRLAIALRFVTVENQILVSALKDAIDALAEVKGAWTAIAHDLHYIGELIDKNIGEAAAIVMSYGVDAAVEQWQRVARAADQFRKTAYSGKATTDEMAPEMREFLGSRDVLIAATPMFLPEKMMPEPVYELSH